MLQASEVIAFAASADLGRARAFYERHGLTVERRLDGPSYFSSELGLDVRSAPNAADALLMRFTKGG